MSAEFGHLLVVVVAGDFFENDQSIVGTVGVVAQIVAINGPAAESNPPLGAIERHAIAARHITRVRAGVIRRRYAAIGVAVMKRDVTRSKC